MPQTDAELLTSLRTVREGIIAQLLDLSKEKKPSYDIDEQKIQWTEYRKSLMEQLQQINEQIALFDDLFEEESTMYT